MVAATNPTPKQDAKSELITSSAAKAQGTATASQKRELFRRYERLDV